MKPVQKITFNPEPIGFHSETKVYYKDVYVGRIVFNDMGFMEYREKGSASLRNMIQYEEFNDKDKIKKYVTKRILKQEKVRKSLKNSTLKALTDKGKEFMKLFENGKIVHRMNLTSEQKAVADWFVVECLLEKAMKDNFIVYYASKG